MMSGMANIWSVKGIGPMGMVTHEHTAMMAIESPTRATDRARLAPVAAADAALGMSSIASVVILSMIDLFSLGMRPFYPNQITYPVKY